MGVFLFLSSGLFLGWSLGANDAANVFGTAVGTRMVKFRTAALVCSVFIVLGAVVSGAGAAHTLGRLGAVNALAGSFTVALAAALTTFWMTRLRIPVSTSQAVVGAIIGWNFYSSAVTDTRSLTRIVSTWVACPLLSAAVAVALFLAGAEGHQRPAAAPAGAGRLDPLRPAGRRRLRLLQPGRQQHRQRDGRLRARQSVPRPANWASSR